MNEHSEQHSTNKFGDDPLAVGGLIIVLCFLAPIMVVIGIVKAISLFTGGDSSTE